MQVSCGPATAFARGQLAYAGTLAVSYAAVHLAQRAAAPQQRPLLNAVKAANAVAPLGTCGANDGDGTGDGAAQPLQTGVGQQTLAQYAARCGAEAAVLQAAAVFTWQACQKMLLQEATRCAPHAPAICILRIPACAHSAAFWGASRAMPLQRGCRGGAAR